jgi:hypothetical protein
MLADAVPGVQILMIGAGDHVSNVHSVDESVDLAEVGRLALAEALMIERLGAGTT